MDVECHSTAIIPVMVCLIQHMYSTVSTGKGVCGQLLLYHITGDCITRADLKTGRIPKHCRSHMFTVHYMSTKVHDRRINNHEVMEIKFALTKVRARWRVTRSRKSRGLRVWKSGRHGMHAVKIEVVS